jgi:acyl-CoA synthetase (AMP-forming)/AMP-acid ligase II
VKPLDPGTLFDTLAARGSRTLVRLSRPLDLAPDAGTCWDVRALARLVRSTAARLAAAGVRPGDHVAVVKRNHWDYVLLACAAARIGAVPALLSDRVPTAALDVLLARLQPALLLTEGPLLRAAPASST